MIGYIIQVWSGRVSTARLVEPLGQLDLVSRHALDELLRNALGL